MVKTNQERLVQIAVAGEVVSACYHGIPYNIITHAGEPRVLPQHGGIVYNVRVGDPAFGWAADHVEPGVSLSHSQGPVRKTLAALSCIGNEAMVLSGQALGARGGVTGKHGLFHVIVEFSPDATAKLDIGDNVQGRAGGAGWSLEDFPSIAVKNIAPDLLSKMGICMSAEHKVEVPVVARVPAELVGASPGQIGHGGDVDIQTADSEAIRQHGLQKVRLGDIVALDDYDSAYGIAYRPGAISIGIVVHGDSLVASHGPGVVPILCAWAGEILPRVVSEANIASLLGIGSARLEVEPPQEAGGWQEER